MIFLSQMTLHTCLTLLLGSLTVTLTILLFWINFCLETLVFFLWFKFWSCCYLSFDWLSIKLKNRMSCFIIQLMTILALIGMVFVIIWDPWGNLNHWVLMGNLKCALNIFSSVSAAAREFVSCSDWSDIYIPHHKYRARTHSSPWFSAACAAATVHINLFFCLYH